MTRNETTLYLKRPDEAPRATEHAGRDVRAWFFRHRYQLVPIWAAGVWYFLADLVGNPVPVALGCIGTAIAVYWYGPALGRMLGTSHLFVLERSRRYAAGTALCAGTWYVWATWHGDPSPRAALVLLLGTALLSGPFWYRYRIRNSLPVVFHGDVGRRDRQRFAQSVDKIQKAWESISSAAHMQGSKLIGVRITPDFVILQVEFRAGMAVVEFNDRRMARLESAFDTYRGAARMEPVDAKTRQGLIRIMLRDPHAEAIPLPDSDGLDIGLFETSEPIEFELINTLVGGQIGGGKSGVLNAIICRGMRHRFRFLGIDMKPGALELGPYSRVMKVARNADQARALIREYMTEIVRRGEIMEEQGLREWPCTDEDPLLVLVIDEYQECKRHKLEKLLEDASALNRAFGGVMIVATQHPIKAKISTTVKANCPQRIGVKVQSGAADRIIFDEDATKDKWQPSKIPGRRKGSLFIRNSTYERPVLGRAYLVDNATRDREIQRWGAFYAAQNDAETSDTRSRDNETSDVIDAVVVDDSDGQGVILASQPVLDALAAGDTHWEQIVSRTGLSKAQVFRHLKILKVEGRIWSPTRGVWKLRALLCASPQSFTRSSKKSGDVRPRPPEHPLTRPPTRTCTTHVTA